jgi:copper homeostasis protein (lipoprotein)
MTLLRYRSLPGRDKEAAMAKRARFLGILVLALGGLAACAAPRPMPSAAVYRGILPCADCPGIDTWLVLRADDADADGRVYALSETYLDRSVAPLLSAGRWTVQRGDAEDPDAIIYVLAANKAGGARFFLRRDDRSIELLDSHQRPILAPLNFTLTAAGAALPPSQ